MQLYAICDSSGIVSRAIDLSVCLTRLKAETQHLARYTDNDNNPVFFTENDLAALMQKYTTLKLTKVGEASPSIAVKSRSVECLNDIEGFFKEIPDDRPFTINGKKCSKFQVTKRWEFAVNIPHESGVSTKMIVCSHQDLLDAYKHKDCWHVRWQHPTKDKHLNFIFDFT